MTKNDLNELTEIKLIILFILDTMEFPLTHTQITELVMMDSLMNYFVLHQYLSDLVNTHQIKVYHKDGKQVYEITSKGKETLDFFGNRISFSIKEKILSTIASMKSKIVQATQITSEYTPLTESEYMVECKIIENETPLINLKLTVGTKLQAKQICEYWEKNAQKAYSQIITALTPDKHTDSNQS